MAKTYQLTEREQPILGNAIQDVNRAKELLQHAQNKLQTAVSALAAAHDLEFPFDVASDGSHFTWPDPPEDPPNGTDTSTTRCSPELGPGASPIPIGAPVGGTGEGGGAPAL